jgi:hypothetical protein
MPLFLYMKELFDYFVDESSTGGVWGMLDGTG